MTAIESDSRRPMLQRLLALSSQGSKTAARAFPVIPQLNFTNAPLDETMRRAGGSPLPQ
jgi:hypothetical protein